MAGRFQDHQRRFTHGLRPWYAQWDDTKAWLARNFREGYDICLDRINRASTTNQPLRRNSVGNATTHGKMIVHASINVVRIRVMM